MEYIPAFRHDGERYEVSSQFSADGLVEYAGFLRAGGIHFDVFKVVKTAERLPN